MNILHLSDVHYSLDRHGWALPNAPTPYQTSLVDSLLQTKLGRVHAIAVSGDLTQRATSAEFDLAASELRRLASALRVPLESVVVTPGNHDIDWEVSRAGGDRFARYRAFLRNLYGDELCEALYGGGGELVAVQRVHDVALLSISSCAFENHQDHYGFIGDDQVIRARALLERTRARHRVAVVHHHLLPTPHEGIPADPAPSTTPGKPEPDLSLVRDAGKQLKALEALGVDLVLHGHKHDAVRRKHVDVEGRGRGVLIFGSGSSGVTPAELPPGRPHHAAIVEIGAKQPVPRVTDLHGMQGQWTPGPRRSIWQAYDEVQYLRTELARRKLGKGPTSMPLLQALREVAPTHTDWNGRSAVDIDDAFKARRASRANRETAFWNLMVLGVVSPPDLDFAVTDRFEHCIEYFKIAPRGVALMHSL